MSVFVFNGVGLKHCSCADMKEQPQRPAFRAEPTPLPPNTPQEHTVPVFRRHGDVRDDDDDDAVTTEGSPLRSPKETKLRGPSIDYMVPDNYPRLKENDESLVNTERKIIYPLRNVAVSDNKLPVNVPTHKLHGSKRENQVINSRSVGSPEVYGQHRLQHSRLIQPLDSTTDFPYEAELPYTASKSSFLLQSSLGRGVLPQTASGDRLRSRRDLSCSNCLQKVIPRHAYNTATAMLSLFVSYRCSDGCCEGCQGWWRRETQARQ